MHISYISKHCWLLLNPHLVATLCSSFSRENGYPLLICSSLSTAQIDILIPGTCESPLFFVVPREPRFGTFPSEMDFGNISLEHSWHRF